MPAITFDQKALAASVQATLQAEIAAQAGIAKADAAKLQSLALQLAPIATQLAFEQAAGSTSAGQYLAAIPAIVEAEAAALAIEGIVLEKQQAINAVQGFANDVANALKDPTTQMLLKAVVGIGLAAL